MRKFGFKILSYIIGFWVCVIAVLFIIVWSDGKKSVEHEVYSQLEEVSLIVKSDGDIIGYATIVDKYIKNKPFFPASYSNYFISLSYIDVDRGAQLQELEVSYSFYEDALIGNILVFYNGFSVEMSKEQRELFLEHFTE